jgi:hypothetical protein
MIGSHSFLVQFHSNPIFDVFTLAGMTETRRYAKLSSATGLCEGKNSRAALKIGDRIPQGVNISCASQINKNNIAAPHHNNPAARSPDNANLRRLVFSRGSEISLILAFIFHG